MCRYGQLGSFKKKMMMKRKEQIDQQPFPLQPLLLVQELLEPELGVICAAPAGYMGALRRWSTGVAERRKGEIGKRKRTAYQQFQTNDSGHIFSPTERYLRTSDQRFM
jgi:hypothetical protein